MSPPPPEAEKWDIAEVAEGPSTYIVKATQKRHTLYDGVRAGDP
jgi:hypothetical protein